MLDIKPYLSFRFSFTVGAKGAAARPCGVGDGAGAGAGLMVGAKENAEGPAGVSEGGLEANEKPEAPETNAEDPPRVKAEGVVVEQVVGTGKMDEADVVAAAAAATGATGTPAGGPKLKGDENEVEEGAVGAAAEATARLGNKPGAENELLGGFAAKEPVEH